MRILGVVRAWWVCSLSFFIFLVLFLLLFFVVCFSFLPSCFVLVSRSAVRSYEWNVDFSCMYGSPLLFRLEGILTTRRERAHRAHAFFMNTVSCVHSCFVVRTSIASLVYQSLPHVGTLGLSCQLLDVRRGFAAFGYAIINKLVTKRNTHVNSKNRFRRTC